MILHLSIVTVASPLLAYGVAAYLPAMRNFRDAISWLLLATVFEMVVVWGWHVPVLHSYAALHDGAFVLQQLSFLLAGLAVWTAAFNAGSPAAAAAGSIALFLTFMHMSMFGLLLTLAPRLLYPPELCLGAFGLNSLEDQQFGGLLMAVVGGMPYLAGAAVSAYRALGRDERPDTEVSGRPVLNRAKSNS
jgi:putative membrane protein